MNARHVGPMLVHFISMRHEGHNLWRLLVAGGRDRGVQNFITPTDVSARRLGLSLVQAVRRTTDRPFHYAATVPPHVQSDRREPDVF
jgi:hypothetical protein